MAILCKEISGECLYIECSYKYSIDTILLNNKYFYLFYLN